MFLLVIVTLGPLHPLSLPMACLVILFRENSWMFPKRKSQWIFFKLTDSPDIPMALQPWSISRSHGGSSTYPEARPAPLCPACLLCACFLGASYIPPPEGGEDLCMLALSLRYIAQDLPVSISMRSGLVDLDPMGVIAQVLPSFYVPGDRVLLCLAHQGHHELYWHMAAVHS